MDTADTLARYRAALAMIIEDPEVQGGAATFRGTRILVHPVAALLAQGVAEPELREDYPQLTPEMIEAAAVYVQAHPYHGRPRQPAWRYWGLMATDDGDAGTT